MSTCVLSTDEEIPEPGGAEPLTPAKLIYCAGSTNSKTNGGGAKKSTRVKKTAWLMVLTGLVLLVAIASVGSIVPPEKTSLPNVAERLEDKSRVNPTKPADIRVYLGGATRMILNVSYAVQPSPSVKNCEYAIPTKEPKEKLLLKHKNVKFGPPCCLDNTMVRKSLGTFQCLHLKVFAPLYAPTNGSLPISAYFHGGQLVRGAASELGVNGLAATFVKRGVVVVTANYIGIGAIGFYKFMGAPLPGSAGAELLPPAKLVYSAGSTNSKTNGGFVDGTKKSPLVKLLGLVGLIWLVTIAVSFKWARFNHLTRAAILLLLSVGQASSFSVPGSHHVHRLMGKLDKFDVSGRVSCGYAGKKDFHIVVYDVSNHCVLPFDDAGAVAKGDGSYYGRVVVVNHLSRDGINVAVIVSHRCTKNGTTGEMNFPAFYLPFNGRLKDTIHHFTHNTDVTDVHRPPPFWKTDAKSCQPWF